MPKSLCIKSKICYAFKLIWSCEVIYTIQVRPICFIICCKIDLTIHFNIVMSIAQYTMYITGFIAFNLMKTSPKNVTYAWSCVKFPCACVLTVLWANFLLLRPGADDTCSIEVSVSRSSTIVLSLLPFKYELCHMTCCFSWR